MEKSSIRPVTARFGIVGSRPVEETVANAVGLCARIADTGIMPLPEAAGRVSSGDTVSLFSLPIHEHSAVDGSHSGEAAGKHSKSPAG